MGPCRYIYYKALEYSLDCRKNIGIVTFFKGDDLIESHECIVWGINREKDGTLKKNKSEWFNEDSLLVDPWYNTIHAWKDLKVPGEVNTRYCKGITDIAFASDEFYFPHKGIVPDIKIFADICQQVSKTLDERLIKNVIPTASNTKKVCAKYILNDACQKINDPDTSPDTYGYLVDTQKATGFLDQQLLQTVNEKIIDEAKIYRIVRLLRHLQPANTLLAKASIAHVYLYLARTSTIFKTNKPLCIELLLKAYETAESFAASNTKSKEYIQNNVCVMLDKLSSSNPDFLKKFPDNVKMALDNHQKKNNSKNMAGKDNTSLIAYANASAATAAAAALAKTENSTVVADEGVKKVVKK